MSGVAGTRIYQAIIVVLLLVIAAIVYKFIVAGSTERIDDRRVAVVLEPNEQFRYLRVSARRSRAPVASSSTKCSAWNP